MLDSSKLLPATATYGRFHASSQNIWKASQLQCINLYHSLWDYGAVWVAMEGCLMVYTLHNDTVLYSSGSYIDNFGRDYPVVREQQIKILKGTILTPHFI